MAIPEDVERLIAGLTDEEFAVLVAKTRAPDTTEQFREIAKSIVPKDVLDTFMSGTNVAAFVDADGNVDEKKVRQSLGVLFGAPNGQLQHHDWGQFGAAPPTSAPGDAGAAEAQRRAERNGQAGTPAAPAGAEALRRMPGVVENAGAAEARCRAAQRGSVAGGHEHQQQHRTGAGADGRAEAAKRNGNNGTGG